MKKRKLQIQVFKTVNTKNSKQKQQKNEKEEQLKGHF